MQPYPSYSSERGLKRAGTARAQAGAVAVEFALVVMIFLGMVMGAVDLARWLHAIDAAAEATREGARVAVVCDKGSAAIEARMAASLATATDGEITTTYFPSAGCFANAADGDPVCTGMSVTVSGYTVPRLVWFLPTMTVPTMTTYLSRESMTSTDNARCTS